MRTTTCALVLLAMIGGSACLPKSLHSTYAQYQQERLGSSSPPSEGEKKEAGERYCSDLEHEANNWSTGQTAVTVMLGIVAVITVGVGTAAVTFGITSEGRVDVPVRNTGFGLQLGGVVFGGLATFTGLRSAAASKTAAEAGNASSSQTSDPARWRKCRAILAAWEDRRDDVKATQANLSGALLSVQKQLDEMKKKATDKKDADAQTDIAKLQATTDAVLELQAE